LFGAKYVQGCMVAFFMGTVLSCLVDGMWLSSTSYGVMETLTSWSTRGFDIWRIPVVLGSFLVALPSMLAWDYSWLHGLGAFGAFLRLFFVVFISIGFVWGFFIYLYPIIANGIISLARGVIGLLSRL